jgi:signal peptidase II
LALAGGFVLVDQLTKLWAVAELSDRSIRVLGDEFLRLQLSRNPGGAFSLLTGFTPVLAVLAGIMTVVLVRTARRTPDRILAYALGMVLGGAVGNLFDRVLRDPGFLRGHVVDFIDFSFWPTFNVADIGISVGVVLIAFRGGLLGSPTHGARGYPPDDGRDTS